jgi:hypothetical protein
MPDFRPHADTSRHPGRQIRYSDTIKTGGKGTGSLLNDIDSVLSAPPEGRPERPKSIFDKGGMMYSSPEDLAAYDRAENEQLRGAYNEYDLSPQAIASQMGGQRVSDLAGRSLNINDFSSYEVGAQGGIYFPQEFARKVDQPHSQILRIYSGPSALSQFKENYARSRAIHKEGSASEARSFDLFSPIMNTQSEANQDALDYQEEVTGNRLTARRYGGYVSGSPFEAP